MYDMIDWYAGEPSASMEKQHDIDGAAFDVVSLVELERCTRFAAYLLLCSKDRVPDLLNHVSGYCGDKSTAKHYAVTRPRDRGNKYL